MSARITEDVAEAARVLREGGLVAFPTETVYGLGANALDVRAVARVFEAKRRPAFDPLIVHVAGVRDAQRLVSGFPGIAQELADRFWPGPLTLVLPKADCVPDLVTAGLPSVGIRAPDHPVAQALLAEARVPIAAPSANRFGRLSPTTAAHVAEQLEDDIDLILDGGPCRVGVESTVLRPFPEPPLLLRPGGVPREAIEAVIGRGRVTIIERALSSEAALPAPGLLLQHYAPHTRLLLVNRIEDGPQGPQVGLLTFQKCPDSAAYAAVEVLSPRGDLREASARLFAALHRLDARRLDLLVAERFPEEGLGVAINDRLTRAAAREA